jgi:predicted Zn-dependent peptidase
MMGWIGPGVEKLEEAYALDLFSVLQGQGRSSRLVRSLREELGLVQGISSDFSLQKDSSLFTISAMLEPQYIERVETLINRIVAESIYGPISEEELARCKRLLCNDYAFSTETPGQLAGLYGYYFTIANPELSVIYPEKIMKLEAEEMQRIAREYVISDRYAVTALRPLLA